MFVCVCVCVWLCVSAFVKVKACEIKCNVRIIKNK